MLIVRDLCEEEFKCAFRKFCSFMCIIHNKKMNYASILILILKNEKIRQFYKKLCDLETDFEAVKQFLEIEPLLHKSKYIKKFLNSTRKKLKLT